ncbi:alpha/beta hydrolase family protein [Planctomyces sp. SH-PL14]|uniref:alpha/beta hydrolase family protein n=1 Tax=Planctomyces sp. SH-PL14 TaxID=1632864 RepID=UPI00078B443F|nr:dienelactone hydrolase family protein [Planctomyces sp. SH-PL14]AMV19863.1 Alpha/beta hydrolase family protein [Planctomyces sp. SH-PL14]
MLRRVVLVVGFVIAGVLSGDAQETPHPFLAFIREQARALRQEEPRPKTLEEWRTANKVLRDHLSGAWGGFPFERGKVQVQTLGTIDREGYRLERLLLETMPGVWMTAHAYVPKREGRLPAILQVHGHWAGAKQDPHVQARCIGAAKHGFFVLAVDAFGAGERGLKPALGEYHGEMVAATLFPTGVPLSGIQVFENTRAVDYLQARPEVDPAKIGITGASGGGNQTMYAAAWDERFGSAVPVCSVGNYQAYLGQACCMCEVVPGALRFTEEWGVLGLTAPRGLMVVNATRDAIQFSVGEAKRSLAVTETIYALEGEPGRLKHAVFESPHDYNKEMREAMYGWMKLNLAGEGDGSPLPDPEMTLEDPEAIRCFPGETRPKDWLTLPQFAAREGERVLTALRAKQDKGALQERARIFREKYLAAPEGGPMSVQKEDSGRVTTLTFSPEPGLTLSARITRSEAAEAPTVILLDLQGVKKTQDSEWDKELQKGGFHVVTCDLRATGALAVPRDGVGRAPDHNSAEWSMWIGRPLLGQWVHDVRQLVRAMESVDPGLVRSVSVVGVGPAGIVAISSATAHPAIKTVAACRTMASWIHSEPYERQYLGTIPPGILRDVGNIADLVGLAEGKKVILGDLADGNGRVIPAGLEPFRDVAVGIRKGLGEATPPIVLVLTGGVPTRLVPSVVEQLR